MKEELRMLGLALLLSTVFIVGCDVVGLILPYFWNGLHVMLDWDTR